MDDDYFVCDHCGAELPLDANSCPHCGSSDEDGWSEGEQDWSDDFDYDEYVADEFPEHVELSAPEQRRSAIVVVLILATCIALAWAATFAF